MKNIDPIRLTQTVKKGGCAAKVAASELRKILAHVEFPPSPPELVIGAGTFDDAAIYKLNPALAIVQTLDFFTPIVDSPKLFGQIAAANALSDIYAMGGKSITAMAIFAFPLETFENSIAVEVLQGASDVIQQSGAALVGGHTIDDDTMKFGLSVTGTIHPDQIWSNAGAKVNDVLILTKPLGTGTLTAALKRGEVTESEIQDGLNSMCLLNDITNLLSPSLQTAIHAATDVTGFGLAGHAFNLAKASQVSLHIESSKLPRFEKVMELLSKGFLTKAHRTNREYVSGQIQIQNQIPKIDEQLFFDPQTSGGLLLSVAETHAEEILKELSTQFPFTQKIGSVQPQEESAIYFL
jgi:selenide,water dikinase